VNYFWLCWSAVWSN